MAKLAPRPRLGRGLSSLINVGEDVPPSPVVVVERGQMPAENGPAPAPHASPAASAGKPLELPVSEIAPNPHQPRRAMNEAGIAELAASFKASGVIQPIIVRQSGTGYELIAGERRLRAARLAGLSSIPAVVREVDSPTQAQMALVENIQREDLNPMDRAAAYRTLLEQLGLTQAELAARLGEDRSSIANYLRLLDLAEPVKNMVRDGRLSMGHAKWLAGVSDILEQERIANIVVAQSLSVRNLERLLESGATSKSRRPAVAPSAHTAQLERSLSRQLGMRVQLRSSKTGKGRLTIHFPSLDGFEQLVAKLGVITSEVE